MPTTYYVSNTGNDTTGDGSIDNHYATITKAIAAAVNGDVIEVTSGTYTDNFDVNKVVTIKGANAEKPGNSDARGSESVLLNIKSNILVNAILDGLKFKHTDNITDSLILQSGPTIKNCVFERSANAAGQFARAISTSSNAENYNISKNLFTGLIDGGLYSGHLTWNSGLFLTNALGKTGIIENNTFSNCRTAINADDDNSLVKLRNNDFSNCGTYISFGGSTPPSAGMQIENNTFSISNTLINNSNVTDSFKLNISNNIFKFGDLSLSSQELSLEQKFTIESRMYHKGRSSTKKGIVYFRNNEQFVIAGLTTIASALLFAPSTGETIHVGPGIHTGNVIVNKLVTLLGQDKDTTILQPSTTTATVQITDGASGTTIKNLTVKGKFATQTTTGTGNSENNNSAILVLNTSNNQPIDNLLLENLVLRQASNGIAFNNKHSTNINVKNCVIQNNEGSGIRIASNTETMNGFLVDSCTIQNNNLNAINSNASGKYRPNCTNFKISNCTINNNNLLTTNNTHDISFFGFNGNIEILNTTIECKHAESKSVNQSAVTSGGWGLIIFGTVSSTGTYKPSGNITMSNIIMIGNVIKSVFGIDRYSTLGNISMNNINIKDCESNKANQTWLQVSIGHGDPIKSFLLGNTKLKTILTANIGDVDAVNANFYDINTGSLLSSTDNLLEIKKQIYDKTSNLFRGEVIISQNATIISPFVANSIVNALNSESQSPSQIQNVINYLKLIPGKYTVNVPLVNASTKPKIITSIESTSALINI